jgi:type II restriction enzyme
VRLSFEIDHARGYRSASQRARVLTEGWVASQLPCPACGHPRLEQRPNNAPLADFGCPACEEGFELKSQSRPLGRRIAAGAHRSTLARVRAPERPNLLLMHYDLRDLSVRSLLVVPKQFLVPVFISERPPLRAGARREGWVGCNILLDGIPEAGRIAIVEAGSPRPRREVQAAWRRVLAMREITGDAARGWLLSVLRCVERLGGREFALADIYAFAPELARLHPGNRNVEPKIRQQPQRLRDAGQIEFLGRGRYRRLV